MKFRLRLPKRMLKRRGRLRAIGCWLLLLVSLFGWTDAAVAQTVDDLQLGVGSVAPELDIELWFSDRDGEFERTTKFKPGKVYVLDFFPVGNWEAGMAVSRYAILQDKYFKKGVQVICVTDGDEETVADFLEGDVSDRPEMIYAELAMHYCFTSDPDRSVFDQYVGPTQHFGPMTFIVGKDGFVEWIGESTKMEAALKKIMAGKWDRDAIRDAALARKALKLKAAQIQELYEAGDLEGALKLIDEVFAEPVEGPAAEQLAELRLTIMLALNTGDIAVALQTLADIHWEESYDLNRISWGIVLHHQAGNEISPELLKVATDVSRQAEKLAGEKGSESHHGAVLDTLAHLVFMGGDLDKALELQYEALEISQDTEITDYLAELKKHKAERDAEEKKAEAEAGAQSKAEAEAGAQSKAESESEAESNSQPTEAESSEEEPPESESTESEDAPSVVADTEEVEVER